MADTGHLEGVLDDLGDAGDDGKVSVRDVISAFEDGSAGAIITVLGLIAAMPVVGGVPGMSILVGVLTLLVLAQVLFRSKRGIWLPGFIADREMEEESLDKGVEGARPYVRWLDRFIRPRLTPLTEGRIARWALIAGAALMALALIPMEVVPWGATAPALALIAFGLALIARDGALALFGYVMVAVTLGATWFVAI